MVQSTLPIYVQIANDLRQKIQGGVYQAGDKLPSQKQLGAQFGVNRHTVRQAFDLLKDEGLLRVDKGLGAFIADAPICYPIGKRVRYNESLQAKGYTSQYQLIQTGEVPADEKVADYLSIPVGDPVIQLDLLGLVDGRPLIVSTSYFPSLRFPNLLKHIQHVRSISKLMRDVYGRDHIRQRTYISTRAVRSQDARLLQVPINQPILLVQAINVDQDNGVIEYTVTRFRGDGVELMFDHTY
ncbi:MAG: phosphonate metabolism transcriptional regulator PhnF [Elainellaceae cyanobacterium]